MAQVQLSLGEYSECHGEMWDRYRRLTDQSTTKAEGGGAAAEGSRATIRILKGLAIASSMLGKVNDALWAIDEVSCVKRVCSHICVCL